jgi:hypothetical protein
VIALSVVASLMFPKARAEAKGTGA